MRYRRIGDSDLTVSKVALGSRLTYGGGVPDDQGRACVDAAFDVGMLRRVQLAEIDRALV